MSEANGKSIYDYLAREIALFQKSLSEGYEVGVRIGGFGAPVVIFPGTMEFHRDGLINFSGEDEHGHPKEVYLTPNMVLLEWFASEVPENSKKRKIGFEVKAK